MGCFDTVAVPCPKCGELSYFQSKSGECLLEVYDVTKMPVGEVPLDVLSNVNRHSPNTCEKCGTAFDVVVEIENKEVTHVIQVPTKIYGREVKLEPGTELSGGFG